VLAAGNAVIIETDTTDPGIPSELALARNGIVHGSGSQANGTGPFVSKFDPGKHLTLIANDQYWGGRPFLDSVEVDFGVNDRDAMVALDLGKADVMEVAAENIQRMRAQDHTVDASDPMEFISLVFAGDPASDMDLHARTILAQSLDKTAISNVVLQGGGEPASALLPNWLSGYAVVFNSDAVERPQRTEAYLLPLSLAYDSSDAIARLVAERILLNARDAGLTVQLTTSGNADVRLVRVPLVSSDARLALSQIAKDLQLPMPKLNGDSLEDLYAAEKLLLQSHRIIPLLHLRTAVALRANVRGWITFPDGRWNLAPVWLAPEKP
jgi:MarR-like DNA-binding transcriptional regulator SgrR of sgrS sRNA